MSLGVPTKDGMDIVPPTPRLMPTHRTARLPQIEALLPTNAPDKSFALPSLARVNGRRTAFSPKYDLIELPDAFLLHGELAGVQQNDIEIEFTNPQTLTVRGHSERSGIPHQEFAKGDMSGSNATDYSTVLSPDEIAADERARNTETCTATLQPPQAKEKYWLSERFVGDFGRSFKFHVLVDQDRVRASMKNGLLSVIIPKAEKAVNCKVTISV